MYLFRIGFSGYTFTVYDSKQGKLGELLRIRRSARADGTAETGGSAQDVHGQREIFMRSRWGLQGIACFSFNAARNNRCRDTGYRCRGTGHCDAKDKDQSSAGESKAAKDPAVKPASHVAKAPLPVAGPDPVYGNPLAPGMMQLLENDIRNSLRRGAITAISPASRIIWPGGCTSARRRTPETNWPETAA